MPLTVHPEAAKAFAARAKELLAAVVPVSTPPEDRPSDFQISPHVSLQITEADIIGGIEQVQTDPSGAEVARRFEAGGTLVELTGEAHTRFVALCDSLHKQNGWRNAVSLETVRKTAIAWIQAAYDKPDPISCPDFVVDRLSSMIKSHTVLVPLHQVFVQEAFRFGRVLIRTITESEIDAWFDRWSSVHPEATSSYDTSRMRWKKLIQGQACAEVNIEAEPTHAYAYGLAVAADAAALLRILSPGVLIPTIRTYITPLGRKRMDRDIAVVLEGTVVAKMTESLAIRGDPLWKISSAQLHEMRSIGLEDLSSLLEDRDLSDYEEILLSALRIYSRCALEDQLTEKLLHVVVAMETVLVKDSSEPIQDNVALRVAFLTGRTVEERRAIVELVKAAYRKRSAFVHHGEAAKDDGSMAQFLLRAFHLFLTLAHHRRNYQSRAALLNALEDRKLA